MMEQKFYLEERLVIDFRAENDELKERINLIETNQYNTRATMGVMQNALLGQKSFKEGFA
jgi:hypothetical protein